MATATQVGSTTFTRQDDKTLIAERWIDAPRDLVWAAHTQCEHVQQWQLGPEGWTMPSCEIVLRPGGTWHFVWEGPDGATGFSMSGEYREITAPERIVGTERMDEDPSIEAVETLTLSEKDRRTLIRTVIEYPSNEAREAIIATGMMEGWAESYNRLEAYLLSL